MAELGGSRDGRHGHRLRGLKKVSSEPGRAIARKSGKSAAVVFFVPCVCGFVPSFILHVLALTCRPPLPLGLQYQQQVSNVQRALDAMKKKKFARVSQGALGPPSRSCSSRRPERPPPRLAPSRSRPSRRTARPPPRPAPTPISAMFNFLNPNGRFRRHAWTHRGRGVYEKFPSVHACALPVLRSHIPGRPCSSLPGV